MLKNLPKVMGRECLRIYDARIRNVKLYRIFELTEAHHCTGIKYSSNIPTAGVCGEVRPCD